MFHVEIIILYIKRHELNSHSQQWHIDCNCSNNKVNSLYRATVIVEAGSTDDWSLGSRKG